MNDNQTNNTAVAVAGNNEPSVNALFEKYKHKRHIRLAVGTLLLMCVGICYAWSVLNAPIAKEFLDWKQVELQLTFTIFMISYSMFGILGGLLARKLRTMKVNFVISAVLLIAAFLISSYAKSLVALYLGFGVLGGAGVVLTYNAVIVNVTKWYGDRMGIATGILLMGYGLGAFFIGLIYSAIIGSGADWRTVFIIFGIVIAAAIVACMFVLTPPPEGYETPPAKAKIDKKPVIQMECTPLQMMKRPSFWILFCMGTFSTMAGMGIISSGRNLLLEADGNMSLDTVAICVGILSVASACGRIFTGLINDWGGMFFNIRTSAASVFLSTLLVALAVGISNMPLLIVSFVLIGFCSGMSVPDGALVTRKFYGDKNYQVNLQVVMACGVIHSFAATIIGAIFDSTGGYLVPIFVLSGFALIGAACSFLLRKP